MFAKLGNARAVNRDPKGLSVSWQRRAAAPPNRKRRRSLRPARPRRRRPSPRRARSRPSPRAAVDLPVGVVLTVGDRVAELVEPWTGRGTAEKQIKAYRTQLRKTLKRTERRGTSARRKATTEARKTRNRVEREARKRQRSVESTIRRNRDEVESRVRRALDEQTSRAQGSSTRSPISSPRSAESTAHPRSPDRPGPPGRSPFQRPVTDTGRECGRVVAASRAARATWARNWKRTPRLSSSLNA